MTPEEQLKERGWCRFPFDATLAKWVTHASGVANELAQNEQNIADWLRCGGTWFAGVNILPNDAQGRVLDGPPLAGEAISFVERQFGASHLDRAQVSIIYPGYPTPMEGESEAAFRFRRDRDAAHVDGLLPIGPQRRRHLQEPHGFVLGLPLNQTSQGASPMVVWEGSHDRMREAFRGVLNDVSPDRWGGVDLTDIYQETRKSCFETCQRVTVHAVPGEAYLIDRLALHGVAPWTTGADAPAAGRMIAYFRPELEDISDWLA
ncbi:MAG: hypothetical protein OXC60_07445 [Litoreibacter sp.]|nr:hypothetical protein [Litoreibacter sp.]